MKTDFCWFVNPSTDRVSDGTVPVEGGALADAAAFPEASCLVEQEGHEIIPS